MFFVIDENMRLCLSMDFSFMYCDLNNGLKVCHSGHGLNNRLVKVRDSKTFIQMSGIRIPTVLAVN